MTRALVLGGGGARGAFQVGMLLELVGTRGIDFTILRGVSVGALDDLKRTLDILTGEIRLDNIRGALDWHRVGAIGDLTAAASAAAVPPAVRATAGTLRQALKEVHRRYVPIHVLAPTVWFGKDNSSTEFDPGRIEVAIEHGRTIAADAVPQG